MKTGTARFKKAVENSAVEGQTLVVVVFVPYNAVGIDSRRYVLHGFKISTFTRSGGDGC